MTQPRCRWSVAALLRVLSLPLATMTNDIDVVCTSGAADVSLCGGLAASSTLEALTESELEWEEEAAAAWSEVSLLQASLQVQRGSVGRGRSAAPRSLPELGSTGPAAMLQEEDQQRQLQQQLRPQAEQAASAGDLDLDHNGNMCMMCGTPPPHRSGGKKYEAFRTDCGQHSTPTGPDMTALTTPVAQFVDKDMNGFCALNYAKSCADAIANEDYLYWAKSMDLNSEAFSQDVGFLSRYCKLNGFLEPGPVRLQSNFTGLRAHARGLCETKYAQHRSKQLTLLDMLTHARHADADAPAQSEAELLAAWSCAMGDLGCDIAHCAYSFCSSSRSAAGQPGLYGECEGWDPVHGMPMPTEM